MKEIYRKRYGYEYREVYGLADTESAWAGKHRTVHTLVSTGKRIYIKSMVW